MDTLLSLRMASPMGPITLLASPLGLAACRFGDEGDELTRVAARRRARIVDGHSSILDAGRAWIEAWFDGDLERPRPPLDPAGTAFQHAVWRGLCGIPAGTTTTYGELAQRIGRPRAFRAVGQANHENPLWLIVPCHRVIGRDGTLTGYGGGLELKEWMLAHERRFHRRQTPDALGFALTAP